MQISETPQISQIAQTNRNYQHYAQFKQIFATRTFRLLQMLKKYGSDQLKSSPYYNTCRMVDLANKFHTLTFTLITSITTVGMLTLMLHSRRAWSLSAGGPLRSVIFKYTPVWVGWSVYQLSQESRYSADCISEDFAQIENQFWKIYCQHQHDSTFSFII